jgi:2-hydroxy-3-keto-5-methylthiopentenyl-1-phosphate phosphatase
MCSFIEAARLVEPRFRFAKNALAESLQKEHMEFVPFGRWSEIVKALQEPHESCSN